MQSTFTDLKTHIQLSSLLLRIFELEQKSHEVVCRTEREIALQPSQPAPTATHLTAELDIAYSQIFTMQSAHKSRMLQSSVSSLAEPLFTILIMH